MLVAKPELSPRSRELWYNFFLLCLHKHVNDWFMNKCTCGERNRKKRREENTVDGKTHRLGETLSLKKIKKGKKGLYIPIPIQFTFLADGCCVNPRFLSLQRDCEKTIGHAPLAHARTYAAVHPLSLSFFFFLRAHIHTLSRSLTVFSSLLPSACFNIRGLRIILRLFPEHPVHLLLSKPCFFPITWIPRSLQLLFAFSLSSYFTRFHHSSCLPSIHPSSL